jgi:hypothetical protein
MRDQCLMVGTASWYSDAEIDDMCDGLVSNAAKARYLATLGLHVERKPNGRPLVLRGPAERVLAGLRESEAAPARPAATKPAPNRAALVTLFGRNRAAA